MKVKDIIKKQTTIIAVAVVLVAMAAISVSYAIFFDIKKNENNQVITAGTLKVTVTGSTAISSPEVLDNASGKTSTTNKVNITLQNDDKAVTGASNLPSSYELYLYADDDNAVDLNSVRIMIEGRDTDGRALSSFAEGGIPIPAGSDGCVGAGTSAGQKCFGYKIFADNLAKGASITNTLRVWVDDTGADEITGKLSLRLYAVNDVDEDAAAKAS